MKYPFPQITRIDDILKAIEGRPEFIVAEREHFDVVNYMVSMPTSFEMEGPDDYYGALRRECRGIKFFKDGTIGARPFHKFFNIGEKEETQSNLLDFNQDHTIVTKLDGSMIHPMKIENDIRWMTKMGITDVSLQAEEFINKNRKYKDFGNWCVLNDMTPLFEWCSRKQKIVIDYPEDNLVLLAVRHNISGEYVKIY